ncbi:phytanoyl-CoA dioxygenase family protein [Pendulispora brunnea]|uniref:Phytanoyl-CoA dioxygenase family protein n=1 Tax=Pendulispora brunnea TaxID=2905690 RepID=A0ABZ2JUK3_9BACT
MPHHPALSAAQIERFILDGFVRVDEAFPRDLADACRRILWLATGCTEDAPSTWTRPVVRIGDIPNPLFRDAANTPRLCASYDALVGRGRWQPRGSLGTFPIRFPSSEDPGDCGWHIDVSFGIEDEPDFMKWRANVASKGRALLMLFLFSDTREDDAPTRIRVGSHRDIARQLAPHGEEGLSLGELASAGFRESAHRPEVLATGPAGTVYLCHPFLVHAAQPHRGRSPRFLAQPPLLPSVPLDPLRTDGEASPVERAIQLAMSESA